MAVSSQFLIERVQKMEKNNKPYGHLNDELKCSKAKRGHLMKLKFTDEEQNETTSASAMYFTPFIYNILRVVQVQFHKMF